MNRTIAGSGKAEARERGWRIDGLRDGLQGAVSARGLFVHKILRGTPPGEIPIEQPTKFRFIINMGVAKALGLKVPPLLLARADELIE
jgi:hypothetical protein